MFGAGGTGYWLGGFQPSGSSEPSGGWTWVTGEAFNYANWANGEPNNTGGGENSLEMYAYANLLVLGRWNDAASNDPSSAYIEGYVVEYGGYSDLGMPGPDPRGGYGSAVPEPSTWFSGALLLFPFMLRLTRYLRGGKQV